VAKSIRCGAATLCAAAILAVTGCSGSVSINQEKTVAKADVADQISTKVNEKSGRKPESVTCPGDLKAAVGASLDCQMTYDGQPYGVNVTVTNQTLMGTSIAHRGWVFGKDLNTRATEKTIVTDR
jgi:hypothetical protein